jgi:hypothetical protein
MRRHSVLLGRECILGDRSDPVRTPFGDNRMLGEQIGAAVFDTMIRQAGWHLIRIQGSCSRRGFGLTREVATRSALAQPVQAR